MESLQIHFRNVHVKQPSSSVKGSNRIGSFRSRVFPHADFIALARQKFKGDARPTKEPPRAAYASYFAPSRQVVGYARSHTNVFNSIRREHIDRLAMHTNQQLLRLDRLISTDVYVPRLGKSKERRSRARRAASHSCLALRVRTGYRSMDGRFSGSIVFVVHEIVWCISTKTPLSIGRIGHL